MFRTSNWLAICALPLLLLAPGAAQAGNNAAFVSQTIYSYKMFPEETYSMIVRMKNTGTTTWTATGRYRLGSQNPQDNATWGLSRVELPAGLQVLPGGSVNFSFIIKAPATLGAYNMQWQMVQDGVAWFGAKTTNQTLTVGYPGETKACAADEFDMLDWMTMDPDLRSNWSMTGTHILSSQVWPDKFWWVKHNPGNIWDTWLYDDNRIYWYLTEMDGQTYSQFGMTEPGWGDRAHSDDFKRAATSFNFPAVNRCQKVGSAYTVSDSRYVVHLDCQARDVRNLGVVQYSLAGPDTDPNLAGDLKRDWPNMKFLRLTQEYQCGTQRCADVWYLSRRYGLVKWVGTQNGVAFGTSVFNSYINQAPAPVFPCF